MARGYPAQGHASRRPITGDARHALPRRCRLLALLPEAARRARRRTGPCWPRQPAGRAMFRRDPARPTADDWSPDPGAAVGGGRGRSRRGPRAARPARGRARRRRAVRARRQRARARRRRRCCASCASSTAAPTASLDAAFDHAPIGMALFNTDGEYVRVNAALCALLGRDADELIGTPRPGAHAPRRPPGRRRRRLAHPARRAQHLAVREALRAPRRRRSSGRWRTSPSCATSTAARCAGSGSSRTSPSCAGWPRATR